MAISVALVTGVVSGVLTAAFVGVVVRLTNSVILPWYRGIVYSGVEISGVWLNRMEFEDGWVQDLRADLCQRGHVVEGTISVAKSQNGQLVQSGAVSRVSGELRDRLLVASIEPTDKTRLGRAALLVEVVGDGAVMSGCVSWYDSGDGRVGSKAVKWYRKGEAVTALNVQGAGSTPQGVKRARNRRKEKRRNLDTPAGPERLPKKEGERPEDDLVG